MDVRTLLRASLVPIGLAVAARGIEELRAQADELRELVDARRAYLAGDGPLPEVDEHQDDADTAAPEDLPSEAPPANLEHGRFPVRPRHVAYAVLGLALGWGAVSGWRDGGRRAELAAAQSAARSAVLQSRPPAPGSPAALALGYDHLGDDHPADDHPADDDPLRCPDCGWVPLPGGSDGRRLAATLHGQGHTAGLPGL